ncbi:MAG: sialate O-acetylesterase [Planctomycetales bacterium]|nr:sialate O-acetylesterase [Planctomycetales bacterium]
MSACLALVVLQPLLLIGEAEAQDVPLPGKGQFHLFVLAGQSNMAGRGKVEDVDKAPHPRVLVYTKDGRWAPAVDPLHFDKPGIVGVGLGRTFAIELAKLDPKVTIGLIPCAVGGSPISSWEPGGFHRSTNTHPWDDAMKRIHAALPAGTLKGILWHQGESDATPADAPKYAERLGQLVSRFRSELKAPETPFILGQIGQFPERPWTDDTRQVDRAHREAPEKIEHTAFVSSDGLTHKGDRVHFDSKSYRELGRRYAKAYLGLVSKETRSVSEGSSR